MGTNVRALASLQQVREDPELSELLEVYSSYQNNADYLRTLSTALGVRGYVDEAIGLNKRALRKNPSALDIHTDLAVMYGQKRDFKKRLQHFSKIPPRYQNGTAYGNLLDDLGYRDRAIACYERSCREEDPPFYLSFLQLSRMFADNENERRYWLEQGLDQLPGQVNLVYELAVLSISEGNFEALGSVEPDSLDLTENPIVIKGGPDGLELQTRIQKLRSLYFSIQENREAHFIEDLDVFEAMRGNHGCQPIVGFINPVSAAGMMDAVSALHSMLCDSCSRPILKPELLMNTAIRGGDESVIRETFDANEPKLNSMMVVRFASALDDFGYFQESLDLFRRYQFFSSSSPAVQFAARCDGVIYGWKSGNYVLLNELVKELCEYDRDTVVSWYSNSWDGVDLVPEGYFDEALAFRWFNNFLVSVALGDVDEAELKLAEMRKKPTQVEGKNAYLLPDSIAVEADWCDRCEEVLTWCREHVNSESYQTEFSKFSQRETSRFGGAEVGVLRPEVESSDVSLIDFLSGKNKLGALTDWRFQAKVNEQRGDISHLETSIRSYIPGYGVLISGAKDALLNAEKRFLDPELGFDNSATVHCFCKALEIDLRERFFHRMKDSLKKRPDYMTLVEAAQSAKNASQLHSVLRFLNGGFIELGVMNRCLKLARGKTSKKVELFGKIEQFFSEKAPFLLEEDFVEKLEYVVEEFRNPSSHDAGMTVESTSEVREKVGDLLDIMTKIRLIST